MADHLSFYAKDYEASRKFYDAVLSALGYPRQREMVAEWDAVFPTRRMAAYGAEGRFSFWLIEVQEAASPRHVAFAAKDRAAVEKFYQAGLAAGAKDNGAPGLRPMYHPSYYGAFVLDPDGNNVEAVSHR
jgi:catechol 2,3-dioxygenase-like lactoylglutathione lyase family enzyme